MTGSALRPAKRDAISQGGWNHDVTRYPEASRVPGLVLFRWDAPLFFANAELFRDSVMTAIAASPTPVRCVVVAAEPVTSVDVTAADILYTQFRADFYATLGEAVKA
jgi:MFS superfamily sulfate permease-like transporter